MKTLRSTLGVAIGVMFVLGMGAAMEASAQRVFGERIGNRDTIHVEVTLYDFHSNRTNPEFELPHGQYGGTKRIPNMVNEFLDADGKPRMGSNPYLNHGIRFWFRDWSKLNTYQMANQPDPNVSGRNYLDKFRPIYFYGTNTAPPQYEQTAGSAGIPGGEFGATPRTGVGQVPYYYVNGGNNGVTPAGNVTVGGTTDANRTVTVDSRTAFSIDTSFKNIVETVSLIFNEVPNTDGVFQFDRTSNNNQFFPLDGRGFGNQWNAGANNGSHNYSYTMELVRPFKMMDNLVFEFSGDDDVWVFIGAEGSEKLIMDIGGIHEIQHGSFNLDNHRTSHNLENGQVYMMRMFYCERHADHANLRITTNIVSTSLRNISLNVDGNEIIAGDSTAGWAVVGVDTGSGILRPGSDGKYPGTFTWTATDVTPGGTPPGQIVRVTEGGKVGGTTNGSVVYDPRTADTIYVYATKAYTRIKLVGKYRDENGNEVEDSTFFNVLPGAASQVVIEDSYLRRSDNSNAWERQDLAEIVISGGARENSNFYAILRDKFGNWVGPAVTNAPDSVLAWSQQDAAIGTVTNGPRHSTRGQGLATRVTEDNGSTNAYAAYTLRGQTFRDTSLLVISNLLYTKLEVGIRQGGPNGTFIPAASFLNERTIEMLIPSDTTLYVRMTRTDRSVVYAPATWTGIGGVIIDTARNNASSYVYSATVVLTGGRIRATVAGPLTVTGLPLSDSVNIITKYAGAQSMRFYTKRTPEKSTPPLDNPLSSYPPTPDALRLYDIPTARVSVQANVPMPLVAALFATAAPEAGSFLPDKQGANFASKAITWSIVSAGDPRAIDSSSVTDGRLSLSDTSTSGDSVVFKSTWATYNNYFRVRATYAENINGVNVMVSHDILVNVTPGVPENLYIEPQNSSSLSPNNPMHLNEIVFTPGIETQRAYAILRDQWGNFVEPSGAGYTTGDLPTTWTWTTAVEEGWVVVTNGFIPLGEGVLTKSTLDAGEKVLKARDVKYSRENTTTVKLLGYYYDSLVIVTKKPDGSYQGPGSDGTLRMTTNDDTTLYVLGRKKGPEIPAKCETSTNINDKDCWELVTVGWDRDQDLAASLPNPPNGTDSWTLSPRVPGTGDVTVSRSGPEGDVTGKVKVVITEGAPTSMEVVILTPLNEIYAGQPILAEVRYYNRAGRIYEWDPAWGNGSPAQFADTLGCGNAITCASYLPKVSSDGRPNESLVYLDMPSKPVDNANVNAEKAGVSFLIYFAANGHQIRLSQEIIGDDGVRKTLVGVSVPFNVRAGEVVKIVIEDEDGPILDTLVMHQKKRPGAVVKSVGYDEYGNPAGDVETGWCTSGEIPTITGSASNGCVPGERPVIFYDIKDADDNGIGQMCVTYTGGDKPIDKPITECVSVKVTGVSLYATSAITRDYDGDGYLDRIEVVYKKVIKLAAGVTAANAGQYITVTGPDIAVDSIAFNGDRTGVFVLLKQAKSGSLQTDERPRMVIKDGFFDGGDVPDTIDISDDRMKDGAPPVIFTAKKFFDENGNAKLDRIVVKFSERVLSPSGKFSVGFDPIRLFRLWEPDAGMSKTAARAKTRKSSARAAHFDELRLSDVSKEYLGGITGITVVDDDAISFTLSNEQDINTRHYINIWMDSLPANAARIAANPTFGDTSTVRDVPSNHPQRVNRKVPITYGNDPNMKMKAVPNPASPDKREVGPSKNYKTITVEHNPVARDLIVKNGYGGAMFEVPIYVPNDANVGGGSGGSGSGNGAAVKVQVKVYDLVGNLVNASENPNILGSLDSKTETKAYTEMHLYWHGFNSKGMKAAPGTYKIIVHVSYHNTKDPAAKNRKFTGTLGISK